jgi:hypothetical protein
MLLQSWRSFGPLLRRVFLEVIVSLPVPIFVLNSLLKDSHSCMKFNHTSVVKTGQNKQMGNRSRKLFHFNYVHVHADAKKPTHDDCGFRSASLIKVVETLEHATWVVKNIAFMIAR